VKRAPGPGGSFFFGGTGLLARAPLGAMGLWP
jgi:hypothetical protein